MKRNVIVFLLMLCVASCMVISCDLFSWEETPWAATTESWSYTSGGDVMYELPYDAKTLNLTVDGAVDIFMVRMNPSTTTVAARNTQYLVSSNMSRAADNPDVLRVAENPVADIQAGSHVAPGGFLRKDYVPAQNFDLPVLGRGVARSVAEVPAVSKPQRSVTQISPTVGTTTKTLWVDDADSYKKKSATLRAIGENCYVWVVDSYYASQASTEEPSAIVTTETATMLAEKFDEIYSYVRHIFGKESDYMIDVKESSNPLYQYEETYPGISNVSDTGKMINIVLYDIEGDYEESASGGTYGYFWPKDYYSAEYAKASEQNESLQYTNEGKYFYIDSCFANSDFTGVCSTLAHEFQHMINFGEKVMELAVANKTVQAYDTWYTEMLSMVCEDMMQEKLGVDDDASPIGARLPFFCLYYPYSGVIEWREDDLVYASYATAYTFGAYLARNFGGPELIREIATNDYSNQDSVTAALKALGYNETFDSVFKKYVQALVLDNPDSGAKVSLNKSVSLATSYEGYSYPMKAIDIFNVAVSTDDPTQKGPGLLYANSKGQVELRPYGFTLHSIGYTTQAGTLSLEFSQPRSTSAKTYILVQPCSHSH